MPTTPVPPARSRRAAPVLAAATALTAAAAALALGGCGVSHSASVASAAQPPSTGARAAAASAVVPPRIKVSVARRGTAPGYLFVAPKRGRGEKAGPLIYDDTGQAVWFMPMSGAQRAYDFRVQTYRGEPVLTWWQGVAQSGFGRGEGVLYDDHYRRIATVRAGNGLHADFHEFLISPTNTAYLLAYVEGRRDMRRWGGDRNDKVVDNVVQEVDVRTGKVLFQWRGLDHISPGESYEPPPKDPAKSWDPLHLNSIQVLPDGNLLISARQPHTTYKVDHDTGRIIWRMGGRRSDFRMGAGSRTAWQHDARRLPGGAYTWFDNRSVRPVRPPAYARGVEAVVNEKARTVRLVRSYWHAPREVSTSQGNTQTLPNGNKLLGWGGGQPNLTEYTRGGRVLFEARFLAPGADSYRAYRFPWTGHPPGVPALRITASGGRRTAHVQWNGATDVARWRVLTGADSGTLTAVRTVARTGFDTALKVDADAGVMAVEALDAGGAVLGRSATVRTGS